MAPDTEEESYKMSGGQYVRSYCSCQETDPVFGVGANWCPVHDHQDHEGMSCEQAQAEWALDRLEEIANGRRRTSTWRMDRR